MIKILAIIGSLLVYLSLGLLWDVHVNIYHHDTPGPQDFFIVLFWPMFLGMSLVIDIVSLLLVGVQKLKERNKEGKKNG